MNICLFEKSQIDLPLSFDDERGAHILNVLHKKQGDDFTAGIIGGQSGVATITRIDETARQIFFEFKPTGDGKPLNPLKMIIGFPRPIQLKRLLRDIAALGISEVHLTGTELGEKSYMQSDLAQPEAAWKLLREGTVQAGSTHVPQVFIHKSLKDCLESLNESGSLSLSKGGQKMQLICLDNINPDCALGEVHFSKDQPVIAAIGSERGWTDKERSLLEQSGFIRCGMGSRIMRTETAATVAGAIILNSMGRLCHSRA
ncbi:MAG: 16S rRNA (uracil(1498)-N(3))-methyltransferase [Treponema sp.]|nr:16S rRNA (uracil(1498)-N(3))-methyltransferase [Treponema sp.]